MNKIIHKANYKKTYKVYVGFGKYINICTPMCNSKAVYNNAKKYNNHRLWSKVTCKKCLKIQKQMNK